jgi:hypothetical protein
MKKTCILSCLFVVIANLVFAVDDDLIKASDGKWMKVAVQKEYSNVPDHFQYEDLVCIDENGFVEKNIGDETESYVLAKQFPFIFSQKHKIVQRYVLTTDRNNHFSVNPVGETYETSYEGRELLYPEYLIAVLCTVLFLSITLTSFFSFNVTKFSIYVGAILSCFIIGLFFQEKEVVIAVGLSTIVGWFASKIYEGFTHEGLLFVTVISSGICASVISIVFTRNGFGSEMLFGGVIIGFAVVTLLTRLLFEYFVRWGWGIKKRIKNVG